jgi:N-acetylglucosamine PTS system EIIB component
MGKAEDIVAGLGGADNIDEIEACATRLRTVVNDASLVNEKALKAAGAFGVLSAGTVIQVIVGGEADGLSMDINDML